MTLKSIQKKLKNMGIYSYFTANGCLRFKTERYFLNINYFFRKKVCFVGTEDDSKFLGEMYRTLDMTFKEVKRMIKNDI